MFAVAIGVFMVVGIFLVFLLVLPILDLIRNHTWTKPAPRGSLEKREQVAISFLSHVVASQSSPQSDVEEEVYAETTRARLQSAPTRVASKPFFTNDDDADAMAGIIERTKHSSRYDTTH